MSARSDLVDLELYIHGESDKGLKVSLHDDVANAVWLPKSKVQVGETRGGLKSVKFAEVSLPEWLAIDKGLV
ncbi:MAG: hypothetical protein PHR16_16645 [Methylovulum sp.]|nr:hypothetical protein [Methylovulum sp.]